MRKRKQPASKIPASTFSLNITSMTDMFTILLVFLLQSYSTSALTVSPAEGLRLPSSESHSNPTEAVSLIVREDGVELEGEMIVEFESATFKRADVDRNDPSFVPKLFSALRAIAEKEKELREDQELSEGEEPQARILMQADQNLSYETLRRVMYTASMAGFPQLKMATMYGE